MPEIKDEFDDLVAQLLEERPRIDPTFARDLDARAAAGFPRRRRFTLPSVQWRFPLWVPAGGLAAVIAVVIALGATGGGSTTSNDLGGASVAAGPAPNTTTTEAQKSTAQTFSGEADQAARDSAGAG